MNMKDLRISPTFGKFTVPLNVLDWQKEYTAIWQASIPEVKKVVYDIPNNTTIVYFADGTKEIARVRDGDTFDKETGVLQYIAKKMYGSRSKFLKSVVNKGIVVEKKDEKIKQSSHTDIKDKRGNTLLRIENPTYLDRFLKGEKIAINCVTEDDARQLFEILKVKGVVWSVDEELNTNETCWKAYDEDTCYSINSFRLKYCSISYYEDCGYQIIKFEDIFKN